MVEVAKTPPKWGGGERQMIINDSTGHKPCPLHIQMNWSYALHTHDAAQPYDELIPRRRLLLNLDFEAGIVVLHENARDAVRALLMVDRA